MRILNDGQVEALLKEVEKNKEDIIELAKTSSEASLRIKDINREINEHQEAIVELEKESYIKKQISLDSIKQRNVRQIRNEDINSELKENERQIKIKEIYDSIPDFFDSLEMALKEAMVDNPFLHYAEAESVIRAMKAAIDNPRDFSDKALNLREYCKNYEAMIMNLCTKRADGISINSREANAPKEYLASVLSRVEYMWIR